MFDIHTHILPGVDDGAESLEEALSMLRTLKSKGFNGVFLTPHLNHPTVKTDKEFILRTFEDLKTELEKQLQVYLGSELYLSPNYEEPIPLGDTDLVLVQLPTDVYPQYLEETIFDLQLSGYRIILAHVERYRWLAENEPLIEKLRDRNVLFQINLRALVAKHGRAIWFKKHNLIDFVSTDCHGLDDLKVLDRGLVHYRELIKRGEELLF